MNPEKSRNNKGKNNPNFKHGNYSKNLIDKQKFYCKRINCNNKVCYDNFRKGRGLCKSCANKGQKNNKYIDNRTKKIYYCIDCDRKIHYQTWRYGNKRCQKCAKQGKLHPQYIERLNREYNLEFNNNLKEQIRKRDNYTCQICGMTEEEHLIVIGEVLNVHHIDYDKENCDKNNLKALCRQCNARVNFNRNYWKDYFKCNMIKQ